MGFSLIHTLPEMAIKSGLYKLSVRGRVIYIHTHIHENFHTLSCLPRAMPLSPTQAQLTTTQLAVDHAPPPAATAAADSCHPTSRPARTPRLVRRAIARPRDHRSTAATRAQQQHYQQKHIAPPKWTCSKATNTCHIQGILHNVLMKMCQ